MIDITVVIPAYNESLRISPFLKSLAGHCARSAQKYEVLVVDDGSTDTTAQIVAEFAKSHDFIRLIRHPKNRGKGAAVRTGMLESRGRYCLFIDADGSFDPADIEPNIRRLETDYDVVIGSRFVKDGQPPIFETWHHYLMRLVLNGLSRVILGYRVHDSQCGLKMFRGEAARRLFSKVTITDFSFDPELLFLTRRMGLRLGESRVSCIAKKGSKVNILHDTARLLVNIFKIRFVNRYDLT